MKKLNPALFRPAFIVCLALLTVTAATKSIVIEILDVKLTKLPIDLKKPLDQMDEKKLFPYKVLGKQIIANQDVVASLGTEKYIQWDLEDTRELSDSPARRCMLFITYYTGNPDMVPHVPDECYVGGGNTRLGAETITATIPWPGQEKPLDVSFQYVLFGRKSETYLQADNQFSVQYLFKANGEFCEDRTKTRLVLGGNFFCKYSYFAKVEWRFPYILNPNREQTLAASEKLLAVVLPLLEEEHWPDWEEANRSDVKQE